VHASQLPNRLKHAGYKKRKKLLNRNFINQGGSGGGGSGVDVAASLQREKDQDDLDRTCGFHLFNDGPEKLGWLINFNTCSIEDKDSGQLCSAVACYFICQSGEMFKCKIQYSPYLYLQVKDDRELEVEAYLRRKFEGEVCLHASLLTVTSQYSSSYLCCLLCPDAAMGQVALLF
jgi:hypothetical protein